MSYEVILFDFNGVLCQDLFYSNLKDLYPSVYSFIQTHIFSKNSDIPDRWMRAEMDMDDVNWLISENTGIELSLLSSLFLESVRDMKLEEGLLDVALELREKWKKIAIVTDNMDVFTKVTVQHHVLDKIFPVIVNSFDHGIMKKDRSGRLFDIAIEKLWVSDYRNVLLIDDSSKARGVFESKWGSTYPYTTFEAFVNWMRAQAS